MKISGVDNSSYQNATAKTEENQTEGFKSAIDKAIKTGDKEELKKFISSDVKEIAIPRVNKKIKYDPTAKIGVAISKLGTSKAISIGAYAYALNELDKR